MLDNRGARRGVIRLLLIQAGVTALLALSVWWYAHAGTAGSAVLGGLACMIPSGYFGFRFFKDAGARAAKQIVTAFYLGEGIKIILTVIIFVLVFKYVRVDALAFFGAFIVAQLVYWIAPLVMTNN